MYPLNMTLSEHTINAQEVTWKMRTSPSCKHRKVRHYVSEAWLFSTSLLPGSLNITITITSTIAKD